MTASVRHHASATAPCALQAYLHREVGRRFRVRARGAAILRLQTGRASHRIAWRPAGRVVRDRRYCMQAGRLSGWVIRVSVTPAMQPASRITSIVISVDGRMHQRPPALHGPAARCDNLSLVCRAVTLGHAGIHASTACCTWRAAPRA